MFSPRTSLWWHKAGTLQHLTLQVRHVSLLKCSRFVSVGGFLDMAHPVLAQSTQRKQECLILRACVHKDQGRAWVVGKHVGLSRGCVPLFVLAFTQRYRWCGVAKASAPTQAVCRHQGINVFLCVLVGKLLQEMAFRWAWHLEGLIQTSLSGRTEPGPGLRKFNQSNPDTV